MGCGLTARGCARCAARPRLHSCGDQGVGRAAAEGILHCRAMGAAGSGYHCCRSRRTDLGRPEPRRPLGGNEHDVACRPQQSTPHYRTQRRRPARACARGKFDLAPRAFPAFEPASERLLRRCSKTGVHGFEFFPAPVAAAFVVRVRQGIGALP
jgi:hypothetical protein